MPNQHQTEFKECIVQNGNQYTGYVIAGTSTPHGKGQELWSTGAVYKGCFKEGKRNGQGRLDYASGDVYVGSWKDDFPHGYGEFVGVYGQ